MAENAFTKVKSAIASQADAILASYGVRHNKEGTKLKADFTTGFLCPLCGDKSGSASFTNQLYLKCHQCSVKADVFDWLSRFTGRGAWDICKELATTLNVDLPKAKRAARTPRGMPPRMTEDLLQQAMVDLWDHKDAEPARATLKERKMDDQQLISNLEVGWIRGWIVFANRNADGQLQDRYRGWNPGNPKLKWQWFGMGTGGPGIWPCHKAPKDSKVLMLEGEGDVMTAIVRLRLHEQGWHVCTWTAGASSCPQPKDIPRHLHGKEVFIGYDNDVFQGPDYSNYVIQTKPGKNPTHALLGQQQRLRNLLDKLCPLWERLQGHVTVLKCPVDPHENYGGDFRDWVDAGGRDLLQDWKAFPFADLPEFGKHVLSMPFAEVFDNPHKRVRTRVQVDSIARDDVSFSKLFEMRCEMGQHASCASCPGARLFPDQMIDMSDYQRELAVGLAADNVTDKIVKDVIQKPRGCPRIEVVPISVQNGSQWRGGVEAVDGDATQRSLQIFSKEPPTLSGDMEIEGIAYPDEKGTGMVFLASSVKYLDQGDYDLSEVVNDLRSECPSFSDNISDIDKYLDQRARDLAYNVTKIHGRRDIIIAHDLLMHSVLRAPLFGSVQRAWLDICVYGDTRSGKSMTFQRLAKFTGLGMHKAAVSNMSRAGVLMGADRQGNLKPGMFPRNNGKAIFLDEFHFFVEKNRVDDHPMTWLQQARDQGVCSGIKIYGSRDLPAAVRLCIIANWMGQKQRAFQFDCQHLLALYSAPEILSRLDFGLPVSGKPTQKHLDKTPQFWTKERTRSLILRAWAMDHSQVIIDDACFQLAKECCKDWEGIYDTERVPLFTPEEKPNSILRIAIAIANICFSHPKDDPNSVHVRKVHVQWAANWMIHTWEVSGYDLFSKKRMEQQTVSRIFEAERLFTVSLGLSEGDVAASVLEGFLQPFDIKEIQLLTSLPPLEASQWLSKQVSNHVFEKVKANNGYNIHYQLTNGGDVMLASMIRLASSNEEEWARRYASLKQWQLARLGGQSEPDLTPINEQDWDHLDTGTDLPF